jgi:hypothetical protein
MSRPLTPSSPVSFNIAIEVSQEKGEISDTVPTDVTEDDGDNKQHLDHFSNSNMGRGLALLYRSLHQFYKGNAPTNTTTEPANKATTSTTATDTDTIPAGPVPDDWSFSQEKEDWE